MLKKVDSLKHIPLRSRRDDLEDRFGFPYDHSKLRLAIHYECQFLTTSYLTREKVQDYGYLSLLLTALATGISKHIWVVVSMFGRLKSIKRAAEFTPQSETCLRQQLERHLSLHPVLIGPRYKLNNSRLIND